MLWGSQGFVTHWAKLAFDACVVFLISAGFEASGSAPERITEKPRKSIILHFLKIFDCLPRIWRYIPNAGVQRELWAVAGNTKGRLCLPDGLHHTQLCSLCGQAALMLGFSYLSPGKVNEVVALFEEVKMGWVAKTRGSLGMKRGALSGCKWQFWWIT